MGSPPEKSDGTVVQRPILGAKAMRGLRRQPMPNPTLTPTRPTEQADDSSSKRFRHSTENHPNQTSTSRGHQQRHTYMYFKNYTGRQKTFTSGPQRHVYNATQSRIVPTRVGRD